MTLSMDSRACTRSFVVSERLRSLREVVQLLQAHVEEQLPNVGEETMNRNLSTRRTTFEGKSFCKEKEILGPS